MDRNKKKNLYFHLVETQ